MAAETNEVLQVRVDQHETRLNKLDEILDKVRNRPPVWCTLVFAAALAAIGWLAKGV